MLRLALFILSAIFLTGCAHTSVSPHATRLNCNPYAGTDDLLDRANHHVIFLGEMHGTNESPEALQQIACLALERGDAVRIGIEAEWPQGARLDAALAEPFSEQTVFDAAPAMWTTPDGRGSAAMLELLRQIAAWRADGLDIAVFAFDAVREEWAVADKSYSPRDPAMARHIDREIAGFDGVVLVLAGGLHAEKKELNFADGTFTPAASLIRARPAFSLNMLHAGGEAWVTATIAKDDGTFVESVGPLKLEGTAPPGSAARSIIFEGQDTSAFDGDYITGPITASPPAFPQTE